MRLRLTTEKGLYKVLHYLYLQEQKEDPHAGLARSYGRSTPMKGIPDKEASRVGSPLKRSDIPMHLFIILFPCLFMILNQTSGRYKKTYFLNPLFYFAFPVLQYLKQDVARNCGIEC